MARPHNLNGGRPKRVPGEPTHKVSVTMTAPEITALDAHRGDQSRAGAVRKALAGAVTGWPAKKETTP